MLVQSDGLFEAEKKIMVFIFGWKQLDKCEVLMSLFPKKLQMQTLNKEEACTCNFFENKNMIKKSTYYSFIHMLYVLLNIKE